MEAVYVALILKQRKWRQMKGISRRLFGYAKMEVLKFRSIYANGPNLD